MTGMREGTFLGLTTSTGHGARVTTSCATEPSTSLASGFWLCVPTTTRSASRSAANWGDLPARGRTSHVRHHTREGRALQRAVHELVLGHLVSDHAPEAAGCAAPRARVASGPCASRGST